MKRPPVVIKAYDSLPRNPKYPLQEFRLRVVKYHNSSLLLDIREYITSDEFNNYSPKGVSLNREQVMYLAAQLHDIIKCMQETTPNPNQLKLALGEKTNEDNS
jgi:hypothetical protein